MRSVVILRGTPGDQGCFGALTTDRGFTCATGELPWKNNKPDISCIPLGEYVCMWQFSPKHQRQVYHITNVKGRNVLEIHPGNFCGDMSKGLKSDVLGCILLGEVAGTLNGQLAILRSTDTVQKFEDEMCLEPFRLLITAGNPSDYDVKEVV